MGVVSTALPKDLGEGVVHLVQQSCLAGISKAQNQDIVAPVALEQLAPHRGKEASHSLYYQYNKSHLKINLIKFSIRLKVGMIVRIQIIILLPRPILRLSQFLLLRNLFPRQPSLLLPQRTSLPPCLHPRTSVQKLSLRT